MTRQPDDSRIGIALIGAGMIGPSHVAALSAMQDRVRLAAVVSRRPERALPLAEHYDGPAPRFTADLSEVLQAPDVQVVIVATPPSVRIELIGALAAAGKHILLEKPLARTLAEAEQVVAICAEAGVTLGVLFQHRARAASVAARRYIDSGALGALGHVEIAAPLWRDQSYYDELGRGTYARDGGGVMLTQAIHTFDLALSLTGSVTQVQAMTATTPLHQMESEDMAVAGLRFANGAVGSLSVSTASFPNRGEEIWLHFEKGSLCVGRDQLMVHWRDGGREQAPQTPEQVAKHTWHQRVIEDFVEAIGSGRAPMATGQDGLAAQRLIAAIERSSEAGRVVAMSDPLA
ncbi:Gfo/Idh/MocA family protein [Tropicibacter oceani]|uniref:Gfo/Idh/MocA family oxidoreductase n=1 Tax=Tropicibacter oceani TaxID=3058420 RepID=A0ABY8QEQ8_9RHOB|nr:Gfo/Idh/MocA family oxidoreductase [Tropicibacter oceani]WGW03110.1 Gfo/Idh/MocA family oxidoreductase [Tropicibacter oceani]